MKTKKPEYPWMADGKRFVASLQSDQMTYKDFFASDKLSEAKQMASNSAKREKKKALVFDRQEGSICFRCDYSVPKE